MMILMAVVATDATTLGVGGTEAFHAQVLSLAYIQAMFISRITVVEMMRLAAKQTHLRRSNITDS